MDGRSEYGTVKNYAQIRLQIWQNKVCIGQDTALDIPAAEDGADVKGGVAACEALDVQLCFLLLAGDCSR